MAKVTAPLFSVAAHGTFGSVVTYVCGLYAKRAAMSEKFEYTEERTEQQTKFSQAIEVWQSEEVLKPEWTEFANYVKESEACDPALEYYMTGYQTFMSYYLKRGENGWENYPNPPPKK